MEVVSILALAMIGEAVWETLKMTWQGGKVSVDRIGALAVGLLLSISTGMDLLKLFHISSNIPYVGVILTGLLISRGANFMHDILASIANLQQNSKQAAVSTDNAKNNTVSK